mgnify:CR=1 FL=1
METIINLNQPRKPKGTRRRAGRGPTEAKAPVTPEYAQVCHGGESALEAVTNHHGPSIWRFAQRESHCSTSHY